MTFAVVLLVTALICCVLRNPLRKAPWLFYGLAVVFVVLYLVAGTLGLPGPVNQALLVLMNKCLLPTALFVLVMYVGVFPKGSAIRRWLQPLRTPVSIVACILVLGHMVRFIGAYAARVLGGGAVATNVLVSFAIAVVLFAILCIAVWLLLIACIAVSLFVMACIKSALPATAAMAVPFAAIAAMLASPSSTAASIP